jgi:ADP-heptose:LPS heptosyltransferase
MGYILDKKRHVFFIFLLDVIGNIIFLPFRIFKRKNPGNIANILIIRLDDADGVIFSTVVPENLKLHYKGAKITFLTANLTRDIVIDSPYIDEVICYDAPWFSRKGKRIFEFRRFFRLIGEIRRHNYDLGMDLRGDFRHILIMAIAGVKFRAGYGIRGGGFLLHKEARWNDGAHPIENNLDVLRPMSIKISVTKPNIYVSDESRKEADKFLKLNGIDSQAPIIVLNPSAECNARKWPVKRFSKLMDVLTQDYNARIILVGNENDKDSNEIIANLDNGNAVNVADKLSFNGLIALIEKALFFIGTDSLLSRIAILKDRPSVIICSGIDAMDNWKAMAENIVMIQRDIPCKGCNRPECEHNICMDLISVDDVVDAVAGLMEIAQVR